MGYMIIQKKDKQKMSEMVEDILYTAGRLMHCVEEMEEMDEYGERRGSGYGNRYGNRYDGMRGGYGNRDWDDDEMMGERRRYRRY
jgi:hypothetical protein